ncbi:hypothetical protein D3C72_2148060 [compost metagenome]
MRLIGGGQAGEERAQAVRTGGDTEPSQELIALFTVFQKLFIHRENAGVQRLQCLRVTRDQELTLIRQQGL